MKLFNKKDNQPFGDLSASELTELFTKKAPTIKLLERATAKTQQYTDWFLQELVDSYKADSQEEHDRQAKALMATVLAHVGGEQEWDIAQIILAKADQSAILETKLKDQKKLIGTLTRVCYMAEFLHQLKLLQEEK